LLDDLLPLPLAVRLMGVTLSGFEAAEAPPPVEGGGQMVLF